MIYSHTRSHEPENQGRRYWDEASTPLFPFGHGLSYGRFELRQPRRRPAVGQRRTGNVTVSVEVTNTGEREADEVVQLYLHQRHGSASRPVRELKGFERVTLAAGESRTVRFTLGPEQRRYWNAARPGLGDSTRLDLRRVGRRRLDRRPERELRAAPLGAQSPAAPCATCWSAPANWLAYSAA